MAFAIQHHDATAQVVQNRLQLGTRGIEFGHAAGQRLLRISQLLRHHRERTCQATQLVIHLIDLLRTQVALRHLLHALGQHQQGPRQLGRQHRCQQHGAKHRQDQRQRQRANEHARHAAACQRALLVFAVGILHHQRVLQQLLRQRLHHLQDPGLLQQAKTTGAHHGVSDDAGMAAELLLQLLLGLRVGDIGIGRCLQAFDTGQYRLLLQLGKQFGRRRNRTCREQRTTGTGNAFATLRPQHHVLSILLLAQTFQLQVQVEHRRVLQLLAGGLGLDRCIVRHGVKHVAAQVQAGPERGFHLHVKPALDRTGHELVGHQVDQRPRHTSHQHKGRRQFQQQLAAETAAPVARPDAPAHPQDDGKQEHRQHQVDDQQAFEVGFVEGAVAGGLRQQEHHHQHDRQDQQQDHRHCPAQRRAAGLPVAVKGLQQALAWWGSRSEHGALPPDGTLSRPASPAPAGSGGSCGAPRYSSPPGCWCRSAAAVAAG